jgi:uncharacterized protein YjiS (DUF1127 family)
MTSILDTARSATGSRPGFAHIVFRAVAGTLSALARFAAAEMDRRRTAALLGFEDCELRDIGITRADVYAALLSPAGEKPSDSLSTRRDDHRRADEARAREIRREMSR